MIRLACLGCLLRSGTATADLDRAGNIINNEVESGGNIPASALATMGVTWLVVGYLVFGYLQRHHPRNSTALNVNLAFFAGMFAGLVAALL